jgi:hypothetical protein
MKNILYENKIIQKNGKKIVYNLNPSRKVDLQWDNLKSQVKEYPKIHQRDGWEILFSNKLIYNASNPHRNILFTNIKEIEPYDVPYENLAK